MSEGGCQRGAEPLGPLLPVKPSAQDGQVRGCSCTPGEPWGPCPVLPPPVGPVALSAALPDAPVLRTVTSELISYFKQTELCIYSSSC